jgi:hypothetical protein
MASLFMAGENREMAGCATRWQLHFYPHFTQARAGGQCVRDSGPIRANPNC